MPLRAVPVVVRRPDCPPAGPVRTTSSTSALSTTPEPAATAGDEFHRDGESSRLSAAPKPGALADPRPRGHQEEGSEVLTRNVIL